jgi:hypothetical protein
MDGKLQTRVAFSIDGLQSADGSEEPNRWHPDEPQVDPAVLKHIGDTKDDAVATCSRRRETPAGLEKAVADNLNLTSFVFPGGRQLNMIASSTTRATYC